MPKKTKTKRDSDTAWLYASLPKQVSRRDFTHSILPHLKKGKRGPKPKISLYKFFNYILHVLHTGMQWEQLTIYKNEISWQRIYARHSRWCKDGSYQRLFEASILNLRDTRQLDLSLLHGDGSNTVVKKGGQASGIQATSIKRATKS